LVFASSNRIINNNYFRFALQRNSNGQFPTLGESLLASKNYTVATSGDYLNARKFILLGDPAMKLAMPAHKVITKSLNGKPINSRSTGQMHIVCTIIRFCISVYWNKLQGKTSIPFILMDSPFDALSDANFNKMIEAINLISGKFKQILITSHRITDSPGDWKLISL
jgi:hypothetical protein